MSGHQINAIRLPIIHGSEEWRLERRGKINISTASSVLYPGQQGVHGSVYSEYMRIVDELEGRVPADNGPKNKEILDWGTKTELFHLDLLREQFPGHTITPNKNLYQHRDYPFITGTPDALMFDGMKSWVVETKAPVFFDPWGAECPVGPRTQAMLYASMFNTSEGCIVSAMIPPGVRVYRIARNQEWEEWAWAKLLDFWVSHIEKRVAPQATVHDLDQLESRPRTEEAVLLPEEMRMYKEMYDQGKEMSRAGDQLEKAARVKILEAMGSASSARFADGSGFTYFSQTRNVPAKEAHVSSFRVLRQVNK